MDSSTSNKYLCQHRHSTYINRRQLFKLFVGSSITISLWLNSSSRVSASTKVKALVLSCIDFRFVGLEQTFLQEQNLAGKYDWLSLAGASLALSNFPSEADSQTFWEQLQLSVDLHQIEQVIIFDHQDCGAYASKIAPQLSQNSQREKEIHRQYLIEAHDAIVKRYPSLQIKLYFAHLNGDVEEILST